MGQVEMDMATVALQAVEAMLANALAEPDKAAMAAAVLVGLTEVRNVLGYLELCSGCNGQ
jgi:hypothetical protein